MITNLRQAEQAYINELAHLYDHQEVQSIFSIIVQQLMGLNRASLLLHKDRELESQQAEALKPILERLKKGEPLQYILGETTFYQLPFKVSPSVLIPRPETEELVEWVLQTAKLHTERQPLSILDIGTGSGCIPITLKKNLPIATLAGVDISIPALNMAKENAVLNGVEVSFQECDVLNHHLYTLANAPFDIIISNPPYITMSEKALMHKNVLEFEPHTALFVADNQALIFYSAIAELAKVKLKSNGYLFFEINEHFGAQTIKMLEQKGFREIELRKDMMGKDRMVKALFG